MKKSRKPAFRILRLLAMALVCLAGIRWINYDSGVKKPGDAALVQLEELLEQCKGQMLHIYDLPSKFNAEPGNREELRRQCKGRSIYIYDLPPQFNKDLLRNCTTLPEGEQRCTENENDALGNPYSNERSLLPDQSSWFNTGVYSLELLIHQRLRRHPCLTKDPTRAQLFYVPFYASMDFELHKHMPPVQRDALTVDLLGWLKKQPTFTRQGGLDHFMTIGQASYNFARGEAKSDWGTGMLQHAEFRKILKLEVEPVGALGHSFGIPFPTDFHPMTFKKLRQFQAMVNSRKRPYTWGCLWLANGSYAEEVNTVRTIAVKQCQASNRCLLLDCRKGCSHAQRMDLWLNVQYAIQDGSGNGLRHTFDAMIAGAVPIMLWEMAFSLYKEYLPTSQTLSLIHGDEYSLFLPHYDLPEWTPVEHRISRVAPKRYLQLKRKLISLMPSLLYFHHDNLIHGVEDAFLVAMKNVFAHLAKVAEDFEETDDETEARREAALKQTQDAEKEAEKAKAVEDSEGDAEPQAAGKGAKGAEGAAGDGEGASQEAKEEKFDSEAR